MTNPQGADEVVRDRNALLAASGATTLPARAQPHRDPKVRYGSPGYVWIPSRVQQTVVVSTVDVPATVMVVGSPNSKGEPMPGAFVAGPHELRVCFDPGRRLGLDGLGSHCVEATLLVRPGVTAVSRWQEVGMSSDNGLWIVPVGERVSFDPSRNGVHVEGLHGTIWLSPTPHGPAIGVYNPSGNYLKAHLGWDEAGAAAALFVESY